MKIYRYTVQREGETRGLFQGARFYPIPLDDWLPAPMKEIHQIKRYRGLKTESWFTEEGQRRFSPFHRKLLWEGEEVMLEVKDFNMDTQLRKEKQTREARPIGIPYRITDGLCPGDVGYRDEFQLLFCIPSPKEDSQANFHPTTIRVAMKLYRYTAITVKEI